MALWGAKVKPGQDYVHRFSDSYGRLRITRATLGDENSVGWSFLEARVGNERRATLCSLHPKSKPMCALEIELEEDATFSVNGSNLIYLAGYYVHPKTHSCTVNRPTLLKRTYREIPERSDNNKKARREDGKTLHDSDHHESKDEERNDGNEKTNDTPPPSRNKKDVAMKSSAAPSGNKNHQKSESSIQVLSDTDDEKETTSKGKKEPVFKIERIVAGSPDAKVAKLGSKIRIKHVGRLMNGKEIENVKSYKFKLGDERLIQGWNLGIAGMRVGEERRITIPPYLSYDALEQDVIPPGSWLIYTITLLEVSEKEGEQKVPRAD